MVSRITVAALLISCLQGCYFFRKKGAGDQAVASDDIVLGESLGEKAKGSDEEQLEAIYALDASAAPASVRPDPDTYIRRWLLRFREEGSVVARLIGSIEAYRSLIGGASDDFRTVPQEQYDATSLLASLKVAEIVCEGLINPNTNDHPGWSTILPHSVSQVDRNILFLAQKLTGTHSDTISDEKLDSLRDIFETARSQSASSLASYVPVCASIAMDAESLLL